MAADVLAFLIHKSMKSILFHLPLLLLASCSGTLSTLEEGYAYQLSKADAGNLVDSTLRAYVASDRMLPGSPLVASGYTRSLTDTQTYTLSAIPVAASTAYALEVAHEGTMFNGPSTAKRIFEDAKRRAALLGPKVSVPSVQP
jgi:hypothetical protein